MHCHAGISRSATVCIAYMMQSQRMTLKEAYEHVRGRRPIISPNLHFMGQLMVFEQELMCKWATKVPTSSTDIVAVQTPPCYTTQSDRHMSLCNMSLDLSEKHPPLTNNSRSMSLPMGNTITTCTTGATDRRSRDRLTLSLNCERRKNVSRNHPGSPCRVEAKTLNPSSSLTLSTTCT